MSSKLTDPDYIQFLAKFYSYDMRFDVCYLADRFWVWKGGQKWVKVLWCVLTMLQWKWADGEFREYNKHTNEAVLEILCQGNDM